MHHAPARSWSGQGFEPDPFAPLVKGCHGDVAAIDLGGVEPHGAAAERVAELLHALGGPHAAGGAAGVPGGRGSAATGARVDGRAAIDAAAEGGAVQRGAQHLHQRSARSLDERIGARAQPDAWIRRPPAIAPRAAGGLSIRHPAAAPIKATSSGR